MRDPMEWRALPSLCLGLLLAAAGCSGAERPEASTSPPPPPTRALVGWSEKVCTVVTSIDGLRRGIDEINAQATDPQQATFLDGTITTYIDKGVKDTDTAIRERPTPCAPQETGSTASGSPDRARTWRRTRGSPGSSAAKGRPTSPPLLIG